MSIATVLTGGLGNGTFSGSPALLVTDGYSIGEAANLVASYTLYSRAEARTLNARSESRTLFAVRENRTLETDDMLEFRGKKEHDPLGAGEKEVVAYGVSDYLANKSGVTLSSATWSSDPSGVTFSGQTDTTTKSTVLMTVPASPATRYDIKCAMVFSDGAVRNLCAPIYIISC